MLFCRYEAMISKQNYDEALLFAKMNDLDTQVMHEIYPLDLINFLVPSLRAYITLDNTVN